MSQVDRSIHAVLTRFSKVTFSDNAGQEEGPFAWEQLEDFLNYCPQDIPVLEKLLKFAKDNCAPGKQPTLELIKDTESYQLDPKIGCYIGNEDFATDGLLVVRLAGAYGAEAALEEFAKKYADLNGVIAVERY